jgi:hypothetical protein
VSAARLATRPSGSPRAASEATAAVARRSFASTKSRSRGPLWASSTLARAAHGEGDRRDGHVAATARDVQEADEDVRRLDGGQPIGDGGGELRVDPERERVDERWDGPRVRVPHRREQPTRRRVARHRREGERERVRAPEVGHGPLRRERVGLAYDLEGRLVGVRGETEREERVELCEEALLEPDGARPGLRVERAAERAEHPDVLEDVPSHRLQELGGEPAALGDRGDVRVAARGLVVVLQVGEG